MTKQPRWRRLRQKIREQIHQESVVHLRYGMKSGVDHAVSYIAGYQTNKIGGAINDYNAATWMRHYVKHVVHFRKGWEDAENNRPCDPLSFEEEKCRV